MKERVAVHLAMALILCATPFPAAAWYQVEVIVFEYLHPDPDGESWQKDPGMPDRESSTELTRGDGPAGSPFMAYRVISPSRYRLDGVVQSLRSSHDYRPVLHVAWEQPGSGEGPVRAVHLEQSFGTPAVAIDNPSAAVVQAAPAEPAGTIVDGTVRVRSGRFLHVDVDMAYFPQNYRLQADDGGAGASAGLPLDHVRMQTSRKIKLNEFHYLDHPLFGVIVEVSRLRPDAQ